MNWRHRRCVFNSDNDSLRIAIISDTHRADHMGRTRFNVKAPQIVRWNPECWKIIRKVAWMYAFASFHLNSKCQPTIEMTISICWNQVLFPLLPTSFHCSDAFGKKDCLLSSGIIYWTQSNISSPWTASGFFVSLCQAKIKSVLPTVEAISFLFACVGAAWHWEIPKSKNKLYALHI